jgi:hypothetical protein
MLTAEENSDLEALADAANASTCGWHVPWFMANVNCNERDVQTIGASLADY